MGQGTPNERREMRIRHTCTNALSIIAALFINLTAKDLDYVYVIDDLYSKLTTYIFYKCHRTLKMLCLSRDAVDSATQPQPTCPTYISLEPHLHL
jgi:hypothetical protein